MSIGDHQCHCGCNHFRFLYVDAKKPLSVNVCRNCTHTLIEHTNYTRKQAE